MGQIGGMVPPLYIPDTLQGLVRRERLLGQDRGQPQQGLPKRQCRRPFFTRWRARTRKWWAKRHRVI
jgi:hypothetical protein